jgi:very-short-patch-repair endonuclease
MARRATVGHARALRRNAPSTERYLWKLLRDRRLDGLKFRRQFPLGPYLLDFVCLRHRLVIEADGPFHDQAHDAVRDAWLVAKGFRILRFPNGRIENRDWEVIGEILRAVEPQKDTARLNNPSSDLLRRPPSPTRGEG